ncbi:DUF5320 domain-containing protein [Candidatus Pacearchaeota archaeon]|nr:DUF5320 domain-containing protein [Candidatus Pacearchaeota archaeon]
MPRQDRTGPQGFGPLTGRGLGLCGCGMRRGFGFRRAVALTKEEEKKILEVELEEVNLEKQEIEKRLKEIK